MSKRRGREDADNGERPTKKQRRASAFRDEVDMRWMRDEITGIRESLEKIIAEAQEDRRVINSALKRLLRVDEVRRKQ